MADLIRFLVECIGRDSNFLLNVGPTPQCTIQPEQAERLRGVGAWLKVNGDAVYGARPLPGGKHDWGYAVQQPDTETVYLHVLDWPGTTLKVRLSSGSSAFFLDGRQPVLVQREDGSLVLSLPETAPDPVDTVIAVR
ncbi:MAG: alpha-L-fucosidase [candidate division Zixibacteria bacterium]|nr:alpha-L-fucosidase [candidate division Zixibacteria bacterium]